MPIRAVRSSELALTIRKACSGLRLRNTSTGMPSMLVTAGFLSRAGSSTWAKHPSDLAPPLMVITSPWALETKRSES